MNIEFYKYHGTGNDFVIIDLFRNGMDVELFDTSTVKAMCDRRFGIGGDGLILLAPSEEHDFKMIYFNSDGRTSSMCGNGGRCIVKFAHEKSYIGNSAVFEAIDGLHNAEVRDGLVYLHMQDVSEIEELSGDLVMDTGSPHYVKFCDTLDELDIIDEAHKIRYSDHYKNEGINVNFVIMAKDHIIARTYERGVEDETLSCGTGVVACALASHLKNPGYGSEINIETKGGTLNVSFRKQEEGYSDIILIGPAKSVFSGIYTI